jgi:hypothetical protein
MTARGPLRGALLRSSRRLCPLALALAVVGTIARRAEAEPPPPPPSADEAGPIERAEALAAQAFAAYDRKEYAAAVLLYRQAYDASPSADILFNIARIYDIGLGERSTAVTFYRQYVIDPDAEDDRVDIAFERLGVLEQPTRPPASGTIDSDVPPPRAVARAPQPVPVPARESPEEAWTAWRVGGIVAGTVGLVGIGLGAGFGVAALSDAATAREYCEGDVCRSQQGLDAVNAATKNANIATASFVLGGGLVAVGAAMLWFGQEPEPAHPEVAQVRFGAHATGSELGLAVSGQW